MSDRRRLLSLILAAPVVWGLDAWPSSPWLALLAVLACGLMVWVVIASLLGTAGVRDGRMASLLLLVSVVFSVAISPRPLDLAWPLANRLLWGIAAMALIATWRQESSLGRAASGPREDHPGQGGRLAMLLGFACLVPWLPLASNERAGTLAMFVPLLAVPWAAGVAGGRIWLRIAAGLASVWILGSLMASGSRGGLLAAVAGLWAAALARRPKRPSLRACAWTTIAVLALSTLVLTTASGRMAIARVIADGSPQGLSVRLALKGRPEIWQRALLMLEDVPLSGAGLGSFGRVLHDCYPLDFAAGVTLEDAHQFALTTWLDLGPFGLLALVMLVARGLERAWSGARRPSAGSPRALAAGLFGSLIAWLLFGLADAVALGTPGSIAWWLILGVVWTLEPAAGVGEGAPPARRQRVAPVAIAVFVLVAGAYACGWRVSLGSIVARNQAALSTFREVLKSGAGAHQAATQSVATPLAASEAMAAGTQRAGPACGGAWLAGVRARVRNAPREQRAHWRRLLACDERYLGVLSVAAADDRALAMAAVGAHPSSAVARRWYAASLGPAVMPGARRAVIAVWRRALALDPSDGSAWRQLGDALVRDSQWPAALDAYAAACVHGDPGANACVLAGRLAEYLGDPRQAIAWYRRSRWPPAHARAAWLAAEGK